VVGATPHRILDRTRVLRDVAARARPSILDAPGATPSRDMKLVMSNGVGAGRTSPRSSTTHATSTRVDHCNGMLALLDDMRRHPEEYP
jgi:hypothetical protein